MDEHAVYAKECFQSYTRTFPQEVQAEIIFPAGIESQADLESVLEGMFVAGYFCHLAEVEENGPPAS